MNHKGLHYWKSLFASWATPGTEVSVLSLTQWERGEEKRGCGFKKKKKKSFKQYWQVSTHKVTRKTVQEEKSVLPPPKFTV